MTDIDNVIRAFSADHVVRLTGLSKGQLAYWDKTGFFAPQYASENRREPYGRVYSFRDVVGLRTLSVLRKRHRISLQRLRKFAESLDNRDTKLWATLKLYVLNRDVYFPDSDADLARNTEGQIAPVLLMQDIIDDVADRARKLSTRAPTQYGHVEKHKFVVRNAPVISGTRIPIAAIKRFHEAGYSVSDILAEYPSLTRQDVLAALEHEERLARSA